MNSRNWTLSQCVKKIAPFGDAVHIEWLMLGLAGELGEVLDELASRVISFHDLETELCDVFIYLTLYHGASGVGYLNPELKLQNVTHYVGDPFNSMDLVRSVLTLIEYEKKIHRGNTLRSPAQVQNLSHNILTRLFNCGDHYRLDIAGRLSSVVTINEKRNEGGHYGIGE